VWESDYPFVAHHYRNASWYHNYTSTYRSELNCRSDVDFPFGLQMAAAGGDGGGDATEEVDVEHPDLYCNPADWPAVVQREYASEKAVLDALWNQTDPTARRCVEYHAGGGGDGGWAVSASAKYIRGLSSVNSAASGCCSATVPFPFGLRRLQEVGPACSGSFRVGHQGDTELCGLLPFQHLVGACQQTAYCGMLDASALAGLEAGSAGSVCDKAFYVPRKWGPPVQNFDHLWSSIVTTYECSTGEMWPDIMYTTLDTVGLDQPMSYDYNLTWPALFFIFGVNFLCAFIMLNLPIAVRGWGGAAYP
jgi:hypothetical protein